MVYKTCFEKYCLLVPGPTGLLKKISIKNLHTP